MKYRYLGKAYCFGSCPLVPMKPGDEWVAEGIVRFNLSGILTDMRDHPEAFDESRICVEDYAAQAKEKQRRGDDADLERPVIVVQYGPDSWRVIDGWGRIALAEERGIASLPAVRLAAGQAMRYLVEETDVRGYIEYWNFRAAYWERRDRIGGFAETGAYREAALDIKEIWNRVAMAADGRDIEIAVRWNRWFRVHGESGKIYIGESRYMEPACPLTFDRIVRKREFLELFPIYEEWEAAADEEKVREKARRITISYEYIFAMIRQFAVPENRAIMCI